MIIDIYIYMSYIYIILHPFPGEVEKLKVSEIFCGKSSLHGWGLFAGHEDPAILRWMDGYVPFGKLTVCYGKSPFLWVNQLEMAMFNS